MRQDFSVAINVNAYILLIDEILAVGDVNFQAKCFNKLREIKAQGTTIVIAVSYTHLDVYKRQGQVSAGIVTYNNVSEIVFCLNSLIETTKGMNVEIYVLDNHSSDDTVSVIRKYFPRVHLIESSENLGFGRGHNEILKRISSEFHMVVNPDIQFTPEVVSKLTAFMCHYPEVGIVTPKIRTVSYTHLDVYKRQGNR